MLSHRINKVFNLDLPQHKKANIEDKTQDTLQVIGAGLPRSGTTSLKAAMETLGFDPCHHMSVGFHECTDASDELNLIDQEIIHHPNKSLMFAELVTSPASLSPAEVKSRSDRLRHHMSGYRATVDSPGCDVYKDLMKLYPDAKVILSVRDSDEAWYKSFDSTLGVQGTKRYEYLVYPIPFLRCNEVLWHAITRRWMRLANTDRLGPEVYAAHTKDVQSHVPADRLLTYNVKQGWEPLCEFLNVPVPDVPFPNMSVIHSFIPSLWLSSLQNLAHWDC